MATLAFWTLMGKTNALSVKEQTAKNKTVIYMLGWVFLVLVGWFVFFFLDEAWYILLGSDLILVFRQFVHQA